MKPVIGIPAHPSIQERNGSTNHSCGDHYIQTVEQYGGIPVILPVTEDHEAILEYASMCSGFLIPGGIDVSPLSYGDVPHPLLQQTQLRYDRFETELIHEIMALKKPLLGICRGLQIINVALGGSLYQDVSLAEGIIMQHYQKEVPVSSVSHRVLIEKPSKLYDIFGDELLTNSFHHQSVRDPGRGIRVTARADDGIVEAIEADDYPYLVAVQWHPECFIGLKDNPMKPLFDSFISKCI